MRLPLPNDLELIALLRRYVSPGKGEIRRYLKLLGGSFLLLPEPELRRFAHSLAKDAQQITDEHLRILLASEWRARLTAAWLIGLDQRT
jgi:hypothetical protein